MIVYQTDVNSLLVSSVEADQSPLEPGVYLIPAGCIDVPPPDAIAGHVRRWTGAVWEQVPDHRGEIWYRETQAVTIVDVGDPALLGLSPTAPPPSVPTQEDRIAARTAQRDANLKAIAMKFLESQVIDGANGEARAVAIRAERAAEMAAYSADILSTLME